MLRVRRWCAILAILVSGCASHGVVQNVPLQEAPAAKR